MSLAAEGVLFEEVRATTEPVRMVIPEPALIVLVGISGSGKSTLATRLFAATAIVASDVCRALVSDDARNGRATAAAFRVLRSIVLERLQFYRTAVVDATNVERPHRQALIDLAKEAMVPAIAIVLDVPVKVCQERIAARDGDGGRYIRSQYRNLRGAPVTRRERWSHVYKLSEAQIETVELERQPLRPNCSADTGPFDIIGDVHGCIRELRALLDKLGYGGDPLAHPQGRRVIFLGDLCDRGPGNVEVLQTVLAMVETGSALWTPGNHDKKLARWMGGEEIHASHGMSLTLGEIEALSEVDRMALKERYLTVYGRLASHLVLDGGQLVVAHAGMKAELQGRVAHAVTAFAHYGETTGEKDEFGFPVRNDWAAAYRGRAAVVYGHVATPEATWINNTICIDQGCVFGGKLAALRWPERELVGVKADRVYYASERLGFVGSEERPFDILPDAQQLLADRYFPVGLGKAVRVRKGNMAAAFEVMTRFGVDPRWCIYLPPTMAPCEATQREGFLEHPDDAFAYYRAQGTNHVVVEAKHMGSRAILVLCKTEEVGSERFGVAGLGCVYTRTGRPFFHGALGDALVQRAVADCTRAGLWDRLQSNWVVLDAELMPWSAKGMALLRGTYAAAAAAAEGSLPATEAALRQGVARGLETLVPFASKVASWAASVERFREAYRPFCWPTNGLEGLQAAVFHVLAAEGGSFVEDLHAWHMGVAEQLAIENSLFVATDPWQAVDLADSEEAEAAVHAWEAYTEAGGEGFVVKPASFVTSTTGDVRCLVQPALKVRGREYLRIIYGMDYLDPATLLRHKKRSTGRKRALAGDEFALGIEALERFVRREPLQRVHECVLGVLGLESEPVDPRL